jgi:hypothetical protein
MFALRDCRVQSYSAVAESELLLCGQVGASCGIVLSNPESVLVLPVPRYCRSLGTLSILGGIVIVWSVHDVGGCGWLRLHIVLPLPQGQVVVENNWGHVLLFPHKGLIEKCGKQGGYSIDGGVLVCTPQGR